MADIPATAISTVLLGTEMPFSCLFIWLTMINLITFLVFGADKWKARHKTWRISERTLLILSMIGGSVGALLGMQCFHHKTLHKKFTVGIPLILTAQILILLWAFHT